jgi:hypothetical protein
MPVERNNAEERLARLERLLEETRSRQKPTEIPKGKGERRQPLKAERSQQPTKRRHKR